MKLGSWTIVAAVMIDLSSSIPPGPRESKRFLVADRSDPEVFAKYGDLRFNFASNLFHLNETKSYHAFEQQSPGVARLVRSMVFVFEAIKIDQRSFVALCHQECASFPAVVVGIASPPAWASRSIRLLGEFGICDVYLIDHQCERSKEDGARSLILPSHKPVHLLPHERRGHQNDARFLDATAGHIFALAIVKSLGVPFALIIEDDIELMLAPRNMHRMLEAISRHEPFHYSMIGGCRSHHFAVGANGTGNRLVLKDLPGGGDLIESAAGSSDGSRCAHAYLASTTGAGMLLADAAEVQVDKAIDFHLNAAHARNPALSCTFVEPPVACQIRNTNGGLVRTKAAHGAHKGIGTCGATGPHRNQSWGVALPTRLRRQNDPGQRSLSCTRAAEKSAAKDGTASTGAADSSSSESLLLP